MDIHLFIKYMIPVQRQHNLRMLLIRAVVSLITLAMVLALVGPLPDSLELMNP
jgi:hypothetical protein